MEKPAADRDIDELLAEIGFSDPAARRAARGALEAAGLTHPGKSRISLEKLRRVRALLEQSFSRVCPDPSCRETLARERPSSTLLPVLDAHACEHCGGSDNRKALRRLDALLRAQGITRLVVVGGSPSVREQLEQLKPPGWTLRLIDGTERRTHDKARADLEWAQLVLVWGASELDHRVSRLYTGAAPALRHKVVQVAKRGIAALLNAGAEHLERSS